MTQLFTTCSDADIMQFLGLSSAAELATEQHKFRGGYTTHHITFRSFVLIDKESLLVAGRAGYHTWVPMHSRAEVGYAIHDEAQRSKGYMGEAMRAIVAHGFEHMGLNRIEALIGRQNTPSLRLVARLGFVQEGILRQHYCKNGVIEDSICFSLLKQEYDAQKTFG